LIREGRLAEAEVFLQKAVQASPEDVSLLTLLGKIKGRMREYPDAIAIFQRVIQLSQKSADAHVDLAIAYSDAGAFPKALDETSKALAIDPHSAAAHLNRGRILDDLKRGQDADAEFAQACQLAPGNPDGYFYWSFVERGQGNFAKEAALLQRVVKLQPDNAKAFVLLGGSLLEQSRKTEAVAALRKALAINPDSSEATYMLSRALLSSSPEQSKRLRQHFEELRQKQAALDRSKSLGNEAYGAFTKQDWATAIRAFKEALEVCGDCEIQAALHKNLGLTLCKSGDLREGGNELRESLALNPNDPDVVKALAVIGQ
jgi:tetratricopeptide (TPR) repeat protein